MNNVNEVHLMKLMHLVQEVFYSDDGHYIVKVKDGRLKLVEFERQNKGPVLAYYLTDQSIIRDNQYRISCQNNYIVYMRIINYEYRTKLYLLRWDFKIDSTLRYEVEFPLLDWRNKQAKLNFYHVFPNNVSAIFRADYIQFEDQLLKLFFSVDYLVLEMHSLHDYQLVGLKGGIPTVLTTCCYDRPSPFTRPFKVKMELQDDQALMKFQKYDGRLSKSRLQFTRRGYDFEYIDKQSYLIQGVNEIKIHHRHKIIRKLLGRDKVLTEVKNYVIFFNDMIHNQEITRKYDIKSGRTTVLAPQPNGQQRGKYIFYTIEQTNTEATVSQNINQGLPFYANLYTVYLKILRLS